MDMDIDDLDLDLDPIKGFLKHKLEHVRSLKDEVRSTVADLERFIAKLANEQCASSESSLKIEDTWKRICNGKYVVGMKVENSSSRIISDINVVLHWKPITSPIYQIKIFSKTDDKIAASHEIKGNAFAHLMLIIDKPSFIKHAQYEAKAAVIYKSGDSCGKVMLPDVTASVKDFAADAEIRPINLLLGNEEAFLGILACLSQIKLAAHLPDKVDRKLEHYLAIDCMLREVEFGGSRYFIFDGVSLAADGSMLNCSQCGSAVHITVFYRDKDHLYHVLHHVLANVRGLNILPLRYEAQLLKLQKEEFVFPSQMYMSQAVKDGAEVSQFSKLLQKQISALIDFHADVVDNKACGGGEDVTRKFCRARDRLSELETKSDLLYEQLCD